MRSIFLIALLARPLLAEVVVPIASGRFHGLEHTTTISLSNSATESADCSFHVPGLGLTSRQKVAPRTTIVLNHVLSEATGVGIARVECPPSVEITARLQEAPTRSHFLSAGRVLRALHPSEAVKAPAKRVVDATADILLIEIGGAPVEAETIWWRNGKQEQSQTYSVAPYSWRLVDLPRSTGPNAGHVEINVTGGDGLLLIARESHDASVHAAAPLPSLPIPSDRTVAVSSSSVGDSARRLHISPFKGAPFQDPATGLIYMRDRWFDPRTGTFLTPDRAGTRDSSNQYAYCGGDPVNCTDPTGLAGYFFDGTDNDREKMPRPTNVAKLLEKYDAQTFYLKGVGSDAWTLPLGGLTGLGGDLRLRSMYKLLTEQYNRGDTNIDIFGFSRGAALAVAFANLIAEKGIPDTSSPTTGKILRKHTRFFHPTIRFLGIFDTVGSFGDPGGCTNIGYDLNRPRNVKTIRHAVSRDERRLLFPLTSMHPRGGRARGDVVEKAFRGAHSDVGGGYTDNDELARVPLGWMADEAKRAGVPLRAFAPSEITAAANFVDHDESGVIEWIAGVKESLSGNHYTRPICYSNVP